VGVGEPRRGLTTVNTIERLYRQAEGIQLFQEQSAHPFALAWRAAYRLGRCQSVAQAFTHRCIIAQAVCSRSSADCTQCLGLSC
jgi:hypothetical protein